METAVLYLFMVYSSVGVTTGWTAGIRIPAAIRFSLLHSVQASSGVHPTSYPMGTEDSFPWGKVAGGLKLTTNLHLVPRSRMVELYHHFPICLHGIVLN
jgi:hypothetical protein